VRQPETERDRIMSALLLVGSDASLRIDSRKTRSRQFLRQALLLSGAIHLSLLFAFLSLTSRGNEGLVLTYRTPTEIYRQPPSILRPPPVLTDATPPPVARTDGVIKPVPRTPDVDVPVDLPMPSAVTPGDPGDNSRKGGADVSPPTPNSGTDLDRVFSPSEVQELPVAIEAPTPVYPAFERDAGITGSVVAKVFVRADGSVARVEVRGARSFLQTTQEALYRWRFKPARMDGRPVAVWVEIPVRFEF
jgi:protein TonB